MKPNFDLDKIKFSIDKPTWEKAVVLFEKGKVTEFKESGDGFGAFVSGTSPYQVFISAKHYDRGDCNCYLGQKEILCKHMVAVAIYAVAGERQLSNEEKELKNQVEYSGKIGQLPETEMAKIKTSITESLKYIKPYSGPSKIWFQYQDSLTEGTNRLARTVSGLPADVESAEILVDLLLKLDKKLCTGGVDDSDGSVGDFMQSAVTLLLHFVEAEPKCKSAFATLCNRSTSFGWEEPLVKDLGTLPNYQLGDQLGDAPQMKQDLR